MLLAGCTDQVEGYGVLGLNESSHDVVVVLQTSSGGSYLLKAGTWGTLSYSFETRKGNILVFDLDCRPIASLPWTKPDVTVRIAPDGTATVIDQGVMPSGIHRVATIEGGTTSSIQPC